MFIYVGYILSDYSHALWISADEKVVKKAIADYKRRGGCCNTWIQKYKVTNKLIKLDCD